MAGEYIVVFDAGADPGAQVVPYVNASGGIVEQTYTQVLNGLFVSGLGERSAAAIARMPGVVSVQPNHAYVEETGGEFDEPSTTPAGAKADPDESILSVDPRAHLDRINQRYYPFDANYGFAYTGAGAHVFVMDTGIHYTHEQFARPGPSSSVTGFFDATDPTCYPTGCVNGDSYHGDCSFNSHGTHVAGAIGGNTRGVASGVTITSVRVVGCFGSPTEAHRLKALEWIAYNAPARSVVNVSMDWGSAPPPPPALPPPLAVAMTNLAARQNVVVVMAAGNSSAGSGADVCGKFAGAIAGVVTVAASSYDEVNGVDPVLSNSNAGSCIDIVAPGKVNSASANSNTSYATMTATSQATPLVSGTVAQVWQEYPTETGAQIVGRLLAQATSGTVVQNAIAGTPQKFLFAKP